MKGERDRGGFTVVEMLISVAVVAVLAGLVYAVSGKVRNAAQRTACVSNLREIGVALELYLGDNNNRFPDVYLARALRDDNEATLEGALEPYLEDPEVFHCPADRELFESTGSSYFWNSTQSGRHRGKTSFLGIPNRPDLVPLVADKESFHGDREGSNILYADYHTSDKISFRITPR